MPKSASIRRRQRVLEQRLRVSDLHLVLTDYISLAYLKTHFFFRPSQNVVERARRVSENVKVTLLLKTKNKNKNKTIVGYNNILYTVYLRRRF